LSFFCVLSSVMWTFLFAQQKQYTFEEAEHIQKITPKKSVVFLHTDWCTYCKMMEKSTFNNKEIISLLDEHFYFIPFNAESKNTVQFKGKLYSYKPTGKNTGYHEMIDQLIPDHDPSGYPKLVFLDSDFHILYQYDGYIGVKELKNILQILEPL